MVYKPHRDKWAERLQSSSHRKFNVPHKDHFDNGFAMSRNQCDQPLFLRCNNIQRSFASDTVAPHYLYIMHVNDTCKNFKNRLDKHEICLQPTESSLKSLNN